MKTEPNTYSFDDLVNLKRDHWDGVRNYQARNNMKEMKKGDQVLIYHSVKDKEVVGIAEVVKEFYPDPTTDDDRWVVVDIVPKQKIPSPVTLEMVKNTPELQDIALVKQSRLSVMTLPEKAFKLICSMGGLS